MFFRSAIDAWFYAFVVSFPLVLVRLALWLLSDANSAVIALSLLVVVPAIMLPAWLLFGTYYRVDSTFLRVQSGPFTCAVPLEQIHDVTRVQCVGWAPALSRDRLKITYGRSQCILISPQRKAAFLEALGYRPSQVLQASRQRPNPFALGENY
ncbi:MAG: PH domain-containing protein [Cyanobacteria bacterium P01_D01_bin.36]